MKTQLDWTRQSGWFFDEAVRRSGAEKRLRRLRPPPAYAHAHEDLLTALDARGERRAAGDAIGSIEADFAAVEAAERLLAMLEGVASAEQRKYADAARAILATSARAFDRAVDQADAVGEKAVARMRRLRSPKGRQTEHAAVVSAFAAAVDANARHLRALQARDREGALQAWQRVEAAQADFGVALHRASPLSDD